MQDAFDFKVFERRSGVAENDVRRVMDQRSGKQAFELGPLTTFGQAKAK
jgi:hypothetical protein